MIKYRKVTKGQYEIINNGQLIGRVNHQISDETGDRIWVAGSFEILTGMSVITKSLTRKAAAEALIIKMEMAAVIQKESTYEEETPEDTLLSQLTKELNDEISRKIQVAAEGSKTAIWIGSGPKHELAGSLRLDFMEFMYIYTDGSVVTEKDYDQLCDRYAEDCGELPASSYDQNFIDTWSDYLAAWTKANKDILCSCCNGSGSVRGPESKTIVRMITCPECKGDGLDDLLPTPEPARSGWVAQYGELDGSELEMEKEAETAAPVCDLCGGSGRVADDILCWKCEQPLLEDPGEIIISDPGAPMIEDKNESVTFSWEEAVEVHTLQRALFEIKEGGEIKIKDSDPHLIDAVIQELSELGIPFIKWAYDQEYTGIMQNDEEVSA